MIRKYIQNNTTVCSIILFFAIFMIINNFKPSLMYNDGEIRRFGVGYQSKTILPVWLLAILLAILSFKKKNLKKKKNFS